MKIKFLFYFFLLSIFIACNDDSNNISTPTKSINLISIYPDSGYRSSSVAIHGKNFGEEQADSYILFNTTKVTEYFDWSDTLINCTIPANALDGYVAVVVNCKSSNLMEYKINGQPVFSSVDIGDQIWMKENLSVMYYRNGDIIPQVQDPSLWVNLTTGAWCYYSYNVGNGVEYGKLYNWYAVVDSRGLAPTGWHIPSVNEWKTLVEYCGSNDIAGDKLKQTGFSHWLESNTSASDEFGFSALGAGYIGNYGAFDKIKSYAYWWATNEFDLDYAFYFYVNSHSPNVYEGYEKKKFGFSVRCIKD